MNAVHHTLIVGGTRGTGRVTASQFAAIGHAVHVIGRRPPDVPHTGETIRFHEADICDAGQRDRALDEILREAGTLDSVVFFQRMRTKDQDWEAEIATSLTASKEIVERVAGTFDTVAGASIVFVSSLASRLIADEQPIGYHVAKAGIEQMVRYFAVSLGPKGVRVNGVAPGVVLKPESAEHYASSKSLLALYRAVTPLGRMGTSREIAQTILFLSSSAASYITGQTLVVDGGLSLMWQESLARKVGALYDSKLDRPITRHAP